MTGRILVLLAAFLWSTSGLFAKSPALAEIPQDDRAVCLTFWRAVFACLMVVFFIRRWTFDWRMLPMAACFAIMTWSFISALVHIEAALAIWLQYVAPAWVVIFSWLFFRESPDATSRPMLAFAVVGLGIILVAQFLAIEQFSAWGISAAIISGVTFAGVVIFLRRLKDCDALLLVFVNQAVTAGLLAPLALTGYVPHDIQWLYLAGFGVFQMGLPYLLFALALRKISSHEASGLGMLEPILVPVWVYLAWGSQPDYQPPDLGTLVGGGLILGGLVLQLSLHARRSWSQTKVAK
ncbi:MAG: EamA family transporter [Planctomycetaceae bacterium]|nr:EamA family transporter [Planctomycetaceae bacterium]